MSIRDFNVEESQSDGEENTDNKYAIDTIHKRVGSEGMSSISLKEESGERGFRQGCYIVCR